MKKSNEKSLDNFETEGFDLINRQLTTFSIHDIEKLIVTLRGVQVLLDRDLAFLYQVEVKQMNRQVKRNIERFPEDFMFQLTKDEYNSLKCHFGTSNERGGDHRALPYAFTHLIDNYVDDRVLSMLTKRSNSVSAIIYTRYNEQFLTDLKKHNEQYPKIEFVQLSHRNHDRFLIIDNQVYLLGASLKDIGAGLCAITEMSIKPETILNLL